MPRRLSFVLAVTLLAAAARSPAALAGRGDPAFARARLEPAPSAIVANQPFDAGFVVVNDGAPTTYSRIVFDLPTDVLLAERPRRCAATLEPGTRTVVVEGALATGEERRCTLSLIAVPDASTHASFALRVETPPDRYAGDVREASIDTPPRPRPLSIAGIGVGPLEIAVITWAGLLGAALVSSRRTAPAGLEGRAARRGQARIAFAVAGGFLAMFAALAWGDWRTLREFSESACEITDSTLSVEAVASAASRRVADATVATPRLALRYSTHEGQVTAIATPMATRLSATPGDASRLVDAMTKRGSVPCWYDPADPRHVVIERGFGGAYLFAIAPLLLLTYGAWLWRSGA